MDEIELKHLSRRRSRPKRLRGRRPPDLTIAQILAWADEHHERTGTWPTRESGRVRQSALDRWKTIDGALRTGARGLTGGSSLPRLLAAKRGVRNRHALSRLSEKMILRWADAHFRKYGKW